MPQAIMPNRSIGRLPPTSMRDRNIRRDTSGAAERDSMRTKIATSAAVPASSPIVRALVQPTMGASTMASMSRTSAAVIVIAPAGS
jgi:hypothetical protein